MEKWKDEKKLRYIYSNEKDIKWKEYVGWNELGKWVVKGDIL